MKWILLAITVGVLAGCASESNERTTEAPTTHSYGTK